MKNKGFTIVELMAVIVILGILSSIALVNVSKYRKDVRDTDLVGLHGTVETMYDKYRQDKLRRGESYNKYIAFNSLSDEDFNSYFSEFTFDGKRLTKEQLKESSLRLVVKGDLLKDGSKYKTDVSKKYPSSLDDQENQYIKDGACMVESTVEDSSQEGTEEGNKIIKSCKKDSSDKIIPSLEEMLCVVIKGVDETIIDDYSDTSLSQRPLCQYFSDESNNGA